ncbi:hypothetical protein H310_05711 [Aphanomyces invadans]|uniref:Association with the SNF1 complex (ASC) domain-containing protein n=1 Tax=Aphanomyces invadans TaxID=157072 RepID=A0A024U765_9STRA|nr:hypothetical protein H310_05711 [Aphanomyces invadans]ETW02119.1 hypothetical protein H310_05711 [Aphanomyces invadans]|eukprot:XP_008868724.1 hypothetical protein H310_05711 [Aphanomyces invadans]
MGSTSSKSHDSHPAELGTMHETSQKAASSGTSMSAGPGHNMAVVSSGAGHFPSEGAYFGSPNHQGGVNAMQNSDTDMDMDVTNSPRYARTGGASSSGAVPSTASSVKQPDIVPMVFRWEHGGRNVCITGTFNGWSAHVPMHRSGNDFTYIANLPRGKHAYKFVVDDEWRFAPDQPTVADVDGNINNYVDVSDFTSLADVELDKPDNDNDTTVYGRFIPDLDEYTKEPPPLPPHLRHIILNKAPPSVDCRLLPVPQHVALNHLYCTAIKDGMMVLGLTQRYKQKFVTTVYYSLMPGST